MKLRCSCQLLKLDFLFCRSCVVSRLRHDVIAIGRSVPHPSVRYLREQSLRRTITIVLRAIISDQHSCPLPIPAGACCKWVAPLKRKWFGLYFSSDPSSHSVRVLESVRKLEVLGVAATLSDNLTSRLAWCGDGCPAQAQLWSLCGAAIRSKAIAYNCTTFDLRDYLRILSFSIRTFQ